MNEGLQKIIDLATCAGAEIGALESQLRASEKALRDCQDKLTKASDERAEELVGSSLMDGARAAVVVLFGNDRHRAAYLRLRGWKQGPSLEWIDPANGKPSFLPIDRAAHLQAQRDAEPFKTLL